MVSHYTPTMPSDHFGPVADGYAAYRPSYPASLFDALAALAPSTTLAWDCGCGTGQAALALAERFAAVCATDASASQIAHATPHPRITFGVAAAHESGLPDHGVDLITVAQALHWFDVDAFHDEVRRVVVPNGIVAEWSYGLLLVPEMPSITLAVQTLDDDLRAWWPPERLHIDNKYADLAFPFDSVDVGAHTMSANWTSAQLLGYLSTWSAVTRYRAAHRDDPLHAMRSVIAEQWPHSVTRRMEWPLCIRVGRVPLA